MVTRFPAGAPMQCNSDQDGSAVTLATFNRPFTREELLGKLEVVVYSNIGEDDYAVLMHTSSQQPEDQSQISLINEEADLEGRLYINGTSLNVYNTEFATSNDWIFDIDFDHQHRKNLELTEGFYYLEIPQFIDSTPDSDLHAVVRMGSSLEDGIHIIGIEGQGYVNTAVYSTEDSTLGLGAWFSDTNNEDFFDGIIDPIFTLLIEMEYHTTADSSIGVTRYNSITGIAVDGSFNPFTDGSPYVPPVPLRVVQRFPNGCPVTAAQMIAAGQTGVPLITFNRPILPEEISRLSAAVYGEGIVNSFMAYGSYDGIDFGLSNTEIGSTLRLIQRGNTLYGIGYLDSMDVIDIDYDEQSKRILDVADAYYGVQKYVTLPAFGAYNQDMTICVKFNKTSENPSDNRGTCRVAGNANGDVKWWDNINGQAVYEDAENMPNTAVLKIAKAVIDMEFSNIQAGQTVIVENATPTGPINLLTATAL